MVDPGVVQQLHHPCKRVELRLFVGVIFDANGALVRRRHRVEGIVAPDTPGVKRNAARQLFLCDLPDRAIEAVHLNVACA